MSSTKTSIILCTYNEEKYIENSINKLQENIEDLELIIVDDDSSDDTRNIISKIKSHSRLKYSGFPNRIRGFSVKRN